MEEYHKIQVVLVCIICFILYASGVLAWIGRYMFQISGRLFGNRWHGFPECHYAKEVVQKRESVSNDIIMIIGCGMREEYIRECHEVVYCSGCGEVIRTRPLERFVYNSRGQKMTIS